MRTVLLQLLVSGLAMGFIYALVGIEYTLIWNSTGLLNFSHDKLITLGAYVLEPVWCLTYGSSKPLAILVTFLVMFYWDVWWQRGFLILSEICDPIFLPLWER